jgi:hypothetical protein
LAIEKEFKYLIFDFYYYLLNSRVGAKTRTRGARPRSNLTDVSF